MKREKRKFSPEEYNTSTNLGHEFSWKNVSCGIKKRTRRKFAAAFKAKVAIEGLKERQRLAQLAERFELHPNQISLSKQAFLAKADAVFDYTKGDDESKQVDVN